MSALVDADDCRHCKEKSKYIVYHTVTIIRSTWVQASHPLSQRFDWNSRESHPLEDAFTDFYIYVLLKIECCYINNKKCHTCAAVCSPLTHTHKHLFCYVRNVICGNIVYKSKLGEENHPHKRLSYIYYHYFSVWRRYKSGSCFPKTKTVQISLSFWWKENVMIFVISSFGIDAE